MKKLDKLEKYVRVPDVQFFGAYFYDGEDILLHDEVEEYKDDSNKKVEVRLTIKDVIENGVFKKHKIIEDFYDLLFLCLRIQVVLCAGNSA